MLGKAGGKVQVEGVMTGRCRLSAVVRSFSRSGCLSFQKKQVQYTQLLLAPHAADRACQTGLGLDLNSQKKVETR